MDIPVVLNPKTVTASYMPGIITDKGTLSIEASGQEDGVINVRIVQIGTVAIFEVVGEQSPIIGMFPYSAQQSFAFDENPGTITVGTQRVIVRYVPETDGESAQPEPGTLGTNTAPGGFPSGPGRNP